MLLLAYIQRIVLLFKPAGIYQVYTSLFNNYGKFIQETPTYKLSEDELKLSIEQLNEKQLQSWVGDVEQLVIFNRLCLFVSRRMKSYQESGFNIVSSILSILLLVLYTVFSFAVINFGLYKIDQHLFSYPTAPQFFTFFYYSFNVLLFNQIQELTAIMPVAQITVMIESFYALFLVAILISLILTYNTQKIGDEMNEAIKSLSELEVRIEGHIRDKYRLDSIDVALTVLEKLIVIKGTLLELVYNLTRDMT